MYRFGKEEVDAVRAVAESGRLFRYAEGSRCAEFERRYAQYLGAAHVLMASSGSTALTAALVGLGVGPGDEVLVPACTYMASAVAVLAAGAIPVVVDVDESVTLNPEAFEDAIGPRTRCVMPVHMWGLPCDMDRIMDIARRRNLLVLEDAAQAAGVRYRGRAVGAIGHAGAFSFNYYKHITCGEGGAVVSNDRHVIDRAQCMVDCCNFYWKDRPAEFEPFAWPGSRASEFEGAMLLQQLDRLDGMIDAMRKEKKRILNAVADTTLKPIPVHDPEGEAGSHVMFILDDAESAGRFAKAVEGTIASKTGRHVYTNWTPVLAHQSGPHPAMNPFNFKENQGCRMNYSEDMCRKSLDTLSRIVFIRTHPDDTEEKIDQTIQQLRTAATMMDNPSPAKQISGVG